MYTILYYHSLSSDSALFHSPFYPAPRESLHGYFLRLQILYGIDDTENVVSSKRNSWNPVITVPHLSAEHMNRVPPTRLFRMIKESLRTNRFSINLEKVDEIYRSLKLIRKAYLRTTYIPIKFCKKCLEEQLVNFGFGYFEESWPFLTECVTHKCTLKVFLPKARNKTFRALKDLLAARPVGEEFIVHSDNNKVFEHKFPSNYLFAPCASLIAEKLLWDLQVFPSGYTEVIDYKKLARCSIKLLRRLNYEYEVLPRWNRLIMSLEHEQFDRLKTHLFAELEPIKKLSTSGNESSSKSDCYKSKSLNCDKCAIRCPASYRVGSVLKESSEHSKFKSDFTGCDFILINLLVDIEDANKKIISEAKSQLKCDRSATLGTGAYHHMRDLAEDMQLYCSSKSAASNYTDNEERRYEDEPTAKIRNS